MQSARPHVSWVGLIIEAGFPALKFQYTSSTYVLKLNNFRDLTLLSKPQYLEVLTLDARFRGPPSLLCWGCRLPACN
jgi:hypothetical protein